MNYFKQLRAFKRQRMIKPLTSNAMLLYFILLEYANDLYFPVSFTAANSVLSSLCGFSIPTLLRRREELCSKGYIVYEEGKTDKCGTYLIVPIGFQNDDASDNRTDNQSDNTSET